MTIAHTPAHGRRLPHGRWLAWLAALLVVVAVAVVLLVRSDVLGGSSGSSVREGSGVAATETRELPAFAAVELAGTNEVVVTVGGARKVVVHADDNLLDRVTTAVVRDSLVVGDTGSFTTKAPMRVEVTVPTLDVLRLSGAGTMTADGIDAQSLTVRLSGTGALRASGTADRLDVALAGTGDAQLDGLVAGDVRAVVSGSGRILVNATRSLDASVPGTGAVVYVGDPARVTTDVTGTGAVTRG